MRGMKTAPLSNTVTAPAPPRLPAVTFIGLLLLLVAAQLAPAASRSAPAPDSELALVEQLISEVGGYLSIDDLLVNPAMPGWEAVSDVINRGYDDTAVWYRLGLVNPTDQPLKRYLEIAYPLLDHVELYRVEEGLVTASFLTGDRVAHRQRPLNQRTFVFPLTLNPGRDQSVYLRIQTSGSHQVPMQLWAPEAFQDHDRLDMTSRGMFYGMLLIMAVFNLFLWRTFGERSFLYFAGVQFALLASMSTLHGVTFMYLVPDFPRLHELLILTGVPLSVLFFCLFCREFLDLKQRLPRGELLARMCTWLCAAAALGGLLLSYNVSTRISVNLIAVVCLLILAIGIVRAANGDRQGIYFVTGWFVLLLGVVGHILTLSNVISNAFLMSYAMESGAVLASLVFSFALGDRFHRERQGRIEEQQARLEAMQEREQVKRRLLDQARRHPLTGLPNRTALDQHLNRLLSEPGQRNERLGLVLFKVLGFDDINKTLGHDNAGGLLALLARRLDQHVMAMDNHFPVEDNGEHCHGVAHVEGYVFAFLLRLMPGEDPRSQMNDLAECVRRPFEYMGLSLSLGVNGACAVCPDDSADAVTLVRHAFIAFDQAGRDVQGMAVYSSLANPYKPGRLTLMTELRRAIDDDLLELHLQPQMRLANGRICAAEALLRWPHPEQGLVAPDVFIDLAEKAGLMRPLTDWVISRALGYINRLERAGYPLHVAVNVSPLSLQDPDFADRVLNQIERSGVPVDRLIIEMTESAAMADPEITLAQLHKLHKAGVRLSIDDFGTGHSSLAYLSTLPVHEIKIDRSFVMDMLESPRNETIVRTTIDMCHALGYEVIAEGVENQAIQDRLAELGADLIQGYHLQRPVPLERLLPWIESFHDSSLVGQARAKTVDISRYTRR